MLVKDQIKVRMDAMGLEVLGLAKELNVSDQTVRYWLSGRNSPGPRHRVPLEAVLRTSIDWTEGKSLVAKPKPDKLIAQSDIDLMMQMAKLPMPIKILLGQLAERISEELKAVAGREVTIAAPMKAFEQKHRRKKGEPFHVKQRGRQSPRNAA